MQPDRGRAAQATTAAGAASAPAEHPPRPGAAFERDLRELTFPTTLLDLLPRPVRTRWIVLLWTVLALLVVGLVLVRASYLSLTSVKW